MSASMLVRRHCLVAGQSRVQSRCIASTSRPRAFTPARRVFLKATGTSSEGDVTDDDISTLMEGEDFVPGDMLDDLVLDDAEVTFVELDEDALAAVAAAEELASTYADELVVEAQLDGDDNSPAEGIAGRADEALDRMLSDASPSSSHVDTIASLIGDDIQEAEGVEDVQGPQGFRKYDEEVDTGISEEQRAEVAQYKLTTTELANLVPEDWDTINIDWFSNRKEENIALPEYKLNFIWTERNIAVAVDQVYSRGQVSPLTEYFFWPRKDAWEELRVALEARPWISERDKVILLNRTTEVINFWQQEGEKPTLEAVRAAFPDCSFMGSAAPPPPPPPPSTQPLEMAMGN